MNTEIDSSIRRHLALGSVLSVSLIALIFGDSLAALVYQTDVLPPDTSP
ncbi:MAG: hypothetical protein ACR2HX_04555 [Pyrinomonadaceae bacterium]